MKQTNNLILFDKNLRHLLVGNQMEHGIKILEYYRFLMYICTFVHAF